MIKIPPLNFASLYEEIFDRVPLNHLDADQLLESLPKHRAIYDISKRIFDIILASVGTIVAIPFIAGAVIALSIEGGMPLSIRSVSGREDAPFVFESFAQCSLTITVTLNSRRRTA